MCDRGCVADRGCSYCADEANMYFGHVQQIASDERSRTLLLRCPHCGALYQISASGPADARRISEKQAMHAFPSIGYVFTTDDRASQLADLESRCARLAEAFRTHGDSFAAETYRAEAERASRLRADGYTQADLNELSRQFPAGPWWLNPKAADYKLPASRGRTKRQNEMLTRRRPPWRYARSRSAAPTEPQCGMSGHLYRGRVWPRAC